MFKTNRAWFPPRKRCMNHTRILFTQLIELFNLKYKKEMNYSIFEDLSESTNKPNFGLKPMIFPFSGVENSIIYLILLGFIVGFLGGSSVLVGDLFFFLSSNPHSNNNYHIRIASYNVFPAYKTVFPRGSYIHSSG